MKVNAVELNKALKEFGKVPVTVKVEEIVKVTDETTGKVRNKADASRHAVVRVYAGDDRSVSVDLDKLRLLTKKLGNVVVDINFRTKYGLTVGYPGGDFYLCDFQTTSSAELDITPLLLDEDN